jgi:phosphate transport system substrate-binding protein
MKFIPANPPIGSPAINRPPASGKLFILSVTALAVFFMPGIAQARDKIHIVGSSTVYPFTTTVAEEFGKTTDFSAPIVESSGTGGGLKLFCGGAGDDFPDIANASRAIKDTERKQCEENGVKDITEIKIGYDGIVLANAKKSFQFDLTKEQIFNALAKKVVKDGALVANPYKNWNEIDPSLPAEKIEVYGPPTTSGTRDAFVELVMEKACTGLAEFKAAFPDDDARKKECHLIREDGHYIEAGENDNLIVQKLRSNEHALGIFGYSFLEQNSDAVHGAKIAGIAPAYAAIADGTYSISRPLFIYVKNAHIGSVPGLLEFAEEFVSDKAAGPDGYLSIKGLISLPNKELIEMEKRVSALTASAKSN